MMDAKATGRYLRVPPRKARIVIDEVRGKSVKEALAMLKFVPNQAARFIEKVMKSAAANAESNYGMDRDILKVSEAFVDCGPVLKRIQPRARGMAYRILKRSSHITVVVSEDERLRELASKVKAKAKKTGRVVKAKDTTKAAAPKAKAPAKSAPKAKVKAEQTVPAVKPENTKPEKTNSIEESEKGG
jgi:large subunit ribosomal protein L22